MKVTGKDLQEIYNAGSGRLDELENAQGSQMDDTVDAHLKSREGVEPEALKRLEDRCGELEQEIRAHLSHGLERIEKVVVAENEQSQKFIQRLVDALALLTKKFSESIAEMQETTERQLSEQSEDIEHLHKNNCEASLSRMNQAGALTDDEYRQQGGENYATLSSCVDESFDGLMSAEDEAVAQLLSDFDSCLDSLEQRFKSSRSQLNEHLTDKLSKLELHSLETTERVRSALDAVIESADKRAFDCDVNLKERFSSLLFETVTAFDDASTNAVTEASDMHDSSMADLNKEMQGLHGAMDGLAQNVTDASNRRMMELQDKGTKLLGSYTDELAQRQQTSEVFQKDLEKERQETVSEIWKELSDVRTRFEEKLANLAKSTIERMKSICEDAEKAIITSQQNCAEESKQHAGEKQGNIEKAMSEFIARVQKTRDSALDAITKASGSGGDETEEASAAPEKAGDEAGAEGTSSNEEKGADPDSGRASGGYESRRKRKSGKHSTQRGEGKK